MREKMRQNIQSQIDTAKNIEERRKQGQFSTPFSLAQEIVCYGLSLLNDNNVTFLEPAIGTGAFYSALSHKVGSTGHIISKATGIEIDPAYVKGAQAVWKGTELNIYQGNFTLFCPDELYNFVLTNPPYVRHHYISQSEKSYLRELVRNETGIEISGLSGLYCYFILLTHKWLAPGAVCGWLVPSEFMDVNYGSALKTYLLNNVHLLRIHRYNPEASKFDDTLVSSCVIWFRNEIADYDYNIEFSYDGTHEHPKQLKKVKKSILCSESKWTRFPGKNIRDIESKKTTIGDFFTVKRGIATGDNDFFILEKSKIMELGLDMDYFKPILPSPRHLKTDFVAGDDAGNPQIQQQYYLLDCALTESEIQAKHPALWKYLQKGILETSRKYLCKNRKIWYCQEQRSATPFLCSYMGRGKQGSSPVRFILNLSNAIATNSYLMLYPKKNLQAAISECPDLAVQIWHELKTIAATEIEDEGRVYGGGLKKIEPKELAKVPCEGLRRICGIE